jgi:hypothetical protein
MTVKIVASQHKQRAVDELDPVAQASVDADTVLAGSELDARLWGSASYTIKVATAAIHWTVYGANVSDYSDEVVAQTEASVGIGAVGSYAVAPPVYRYYRAKIHSAGAGVPGTATLRGFAH